MGGAWVLTGKSHGPERGSIWRSVVEPGFGAQAAGVRVTA
jgi:hypothetical protein